MRLRESERETGWPAYHSLSENVLYLHAVSKLMHMVRKKLQKITGTF